MGIERSRCRNCDDSMPPMRLLEHRISADDAKVSDAGAGGTALRAQNYSEGVLLPGLSLHLEQRGRAHHRPALAPLLPRGRESDLIFPRIAAGNRLVPRESYRPAVLIHEVALCPVSRDHHF